MSNKITRSIDELGRVVLPAEYRSVLGLQEKDSIDIYLNDAKNKITLQKTIPSCCICNSISELIQISGKHICCSCRDKLSTASVSDCRY